MLKNFKGIFKVLFVLSVSQVMAKKYFGTRFWRGVEYPTHPQLLAIAKQSIATYSPVIGISIAITKPDRGTFSYAFGKANINKNYPMTSNTLLPIGSNAKPLLLAMALLIIDNYPEQFSDKLKTKLTEIKDFEGNNIFFAHGEIIMPDKSVLSLGKKDEKHKYQTIDFSKINLHHLLLESSGCFDVFSEVNLKNTPYFSDFCQDVFDSIFNSSSFRNKKYTTDALSTLITYGVFKKADPDPEKPMQSHNTDAFLLSIILERATGQSLNELLYQKILTPLKLEKNSIIFTSNLCDKIKRASANRYAFFNTNLEIKNAIENKEIYNSIDSNLALQLSVENLESLGHRFEKIQNNTNTNKYVLDISELSNYGFDDIPGAAGVLAQPKAYIHFYQALVTGKLLKKEQQCWFEDSFVSMPKPKGTSDTNIAVGYGSNIRKGNILSHSGFLIGAQSLIICDLQSAITIMVATNYTGAWDERPCFQVTRTPYFDTQAVSQIVNNYAKAFGICN